tara:strand:- start:983 stop:1225 length:243 start_codon:yes stop_codon:yes gene_type:complete
MSNVIEFKKPDFLSYITDENGKPVGVETKGFSAGRDRNTAHINLWKTGMGTMLSVDEFNQICIAWLALHQPDALKFDEVK